MDIHIKIAAALHIACGALTLMVTAVVALFLGGFAALADFDARLLTVAATLGGVIAFFFVALGLAELIAGVCCLQGSRGARVWLIVFSVLGLFNIPLGTAIGIYSLWALLRERPAPTGTSVV